MYAAVLNFPIGWLKDAKFVICGKDGYELACHFHDVQNIEKHIMNLRARLKSNNDPAWDITERIYRKLTHGESISAEQFKEFLDLDPGLCRLLDFVEADNAVEILKEKYGRVMYRQMPGRGY